MLRMIQLLIPNEGTENTQDSIYFSINLNEHAASALM